MQRLSVTQQTPQTYNVVGLFVILTSKARLAVPMPDKFRSGGSAFSLRLHFVCGASENMRVVAVLVIATLCLISTVLAVGDSCSLYEPCSFVTYLTKF